MKNTLQSLWYKLRRQKTDEGSVSAVLLSLATDSSGYLVGLAVMGLANLVLVPLYTRYLTSSDFGLYALVEVLALGLISLSTLGLNVSYLKWFAESDSTQATSLLSTMLCANGLVGLITGTGLVLFARSEAGTRILGGDAMSFAWLLLPLVVLEVLQNSFFAHFRAKRNAFGFSGGSVLRLGFLAGLSIWLVAGRRSGLVGIFQARVLADLCALLFFFIISASDLSLNTSVRLAISMTRYGLPVMGSSLLVMALDGLGRFFLNHYGSLKEVGLYALAIKLSGVMRMVIVIPFGIAWGGLLFQIAKRPDAKLIYSKIMSYLTVVSVAIALVLSLLSPLLLEIFATKEYSASLPVIPWLLLVQAVVLLQYPASVGVYVGSATKWLLPVFSGIVFSLILNRVLVPRFGMLGAAWSWLGAWALITTLMGCIGQRYFPLHYERKPLLLAGALSICVLSTIHFGFTVAGRHDLLIQFSLSLMIIVCAITYVCRDLRQSRIQVSDSAAD